ncbi:hypothetical protein YYC_01698 [Plasmodium yoelii 17X]|uniref:MI domain-containing protein n=1 Tax=Plasmodium yoelii 17X TaxID=1323249 RepID=V7PR50_PLAYE|nr:hypothetical protein YYC_01698 [Plasmodium yoelii 17X]
MRKKKKDIDDIQERIGQKEKKNLSKNNRRYLSGKENDTKLAKKEKRENTHSISSVENYSSNSSSDTNNSHKNKSQKSIKLKRKRNVRNESSSSETNKTKKKFGKRQINEHEECSKSDREQYQSNRHEKISKSLNEKKRERKERSDSDEGEDEDDNVRYKKERKKREDKKRENKKRENKKRENKKSESDEDEDEDDNARYKNDRNKLKRGRSDSSYMRKSREKERKHFRNKKYNKRSVSNSSNEFDKKKKDKSHYQKRDQNEKKKKNSDSMHDSRDYVHKMKREKHEHEHEHKHEHKHKFRRNGSSSGRSSGSSSDSSSGSGSGSSGGRSSGSGSGSSGGGEEKEYDPFDEDLNKDVEINENLIEYAKKKIANITTEDIGRTGGIYIPPFKLERLQNEITNKKSSAYQKNEWMKLKKKINNIVNKVNIDNIGEICYELFECNLIRGKGIFSRAILHAQLSSPAFTNVFTCLLCIVNSKFPNIGLLTIHRTILHFRRAYKRCDKIACFNSVKFIAHMINQRILNEIVGLQLCSLLLQNITNDSIQVCTYFLAEVGQLYMNICRSGLDIIFDRLKDIIQEGNINVKTQYDIEKLWNYRKDYFKDFPTIIEDLDIISEEDKIIHEIDLLDENISNQEELNIFKEVSYEQYEKEDQEWADISRELLDVDDNSRNKQKDTNESNSDDISSNSQNENYSSNSSTDSEKENTNNDSSSEEEEDENKEEIHDMTEQYLINLRKNIYLSIMSSLSFEECVHKLLKLTIKSGYEIEICNMLIDCCCMEKTFQKFYALQGERLCKLKIIYQENFEKCFENSYNTAHRLETSKLRNCSKFFAHLLYTDSISWRVFTLIKLTEEDTTSSTRIFTKILLQELTNNMGIKTFYFKINHPAISPFLSGLFPSDNSQNIRFSINFFTAIGLGALTSSMRKLLSTEGH